jgi:hypothetical protein
VQGKHYSYQPIAIFYEKKLRPIQNVRHGFQRATLVVPNKSSQPAEPLRDVVASKQHKLKIASLVRPHKRVSSGTEAGVWPPPVTDDQYKDLQNVAIPASFQGLFN